MCGDSLMAEQLTNQLGEGGSIPTSPLQFVILEIPPKQTHTWLLKKHYAKRIPSISYAFGLYDCEKVLQGVATFGTPCKLMNDGNCIFRNYNVRTLELNRLVISENLPKNSLSFFVSKCLNLLPRPLCVVSYSDIGQNHHGYIYQATNWLYTGITEQTGGYTYWIDNDWQHPRTTVSLFGTREHKRILQLYPDIEFQKVSRKHRYFMFLGNKQEKAEMLQNLNYPIYPYPKGENQRYDASYKPDVQGLLI